MKILVVEDEKELQLSISQFLEQNGYLVETASDFFQAEDKLSVYEYDIILLDLMLPDGNGLDLFKSIKKTNKEAGIIILSARDSLEDKIKGLDKGADDYLPKPFHLSELNSRVRAILRRRKFDNSDKLIFGEIEINIDQRNVLIKGKEVFFTKKEFDILLFFITNKNRVLTKEAIAEHLWDDNIDFIDNFDFIYTHINNIRHKIKKAGAKNYFKSIYGLGYKFCHE